MGNGILIFSTFFSEEKGWHFSIGLHIGNGENAAKNDQGHIPGHLVFVAWSDAWGGSAIMSILQRCSGFYSRRIQGGQKTARTGRINGAAIVECFLLGY